MEGRKEVADGLAFTGQGCRAVGCGCTVFSKAGGADIRATLSFRTGPLPHFQQDGDFSPKLWHRTTQQRPRDPHLAELPGWSCTPGRLDGPASAKGACSGVLASHGAPVLGRGLARDPSRLPAFLLPIPSCPSLMFWKHVTCSIAQAHTQSAGSG